MLLCCSVDRKASLGQTDEVRTLPGAKRQRIQDRKGRYVSCSHRTMKDDQNDEDGIGFITCKRLPCSAPLTGFRAFNRVWK